MLPAPNVRALEPGETVGVPGPSDAMPETVAVLGAFLHVTVVAPLDQNAVEGLTVQQQTRSLETSRDSFSTGP